MKKILSFLLSISLFLSAKSQVDTFGFWGYQNITAGDYNTFNDYHIKGCHLIVQWADVKPTAAGAYDWSALNKMLDSAIARNIWVGFETLVGQNSPNWIFDSCGYFTTHGHPQVGPYPKYYNPKYRAYFNQFLKDVGAYLQGLSPARRAKILYWQIAEGSTGDEQPYKGVLDAPYVGDPYVPQPGGFDWYQFRRDAWDTAARCAGYTAVNTQVYLMLNSGNDGADLGWVAGQDSLSVEGDEQEYIESHFSFLPKKPLVKEGFLSHTYAFRGEQSYHDRVTPPSRGEIQGPIKESLHPHKDIFTMICSALDGGLSMLNGDGGWKNLNETYESETTPRLGDFFSEFANTTNEGFSMPAFKVDYGDTLFYPSKDFGALIDPTKTDAYNKRLYNYSRQADQFGSTDDYREWLYWRAVDSYMNPSRKTAIDALYPLARFGTEDSVYYADHTLNATYNYEKNLHQLNVKETMLPVYRCGPDTALYGRYAGKPILDANNKCTWAYDIDNSLMNKNNSDTVRVTVFYLNDGSGNSFSISCKRCAKQRVSPVYTVTSSNGLFSTATIDIPKFKWRANGPDFYIDFNGSVTIPFVQTKNLSKQ